MQSEFKDRRATLQLNRLEALVNVVYALLIVRLFMLIPRPGVGEFHWHTLDDYLRDNIMTIVLVLVGLIVLIIYWLQNNALLGNMERTDGRHTTLMIIHIFFLMIFIYAMKLGIELGSSAGTRSFESVAAMLLGFPSAIAYRHGIKNRRLLADDVSDEEAKELGHRILAEPITAAITLFFIFTPILWEASWLSYPLVVKMLKKRAQKRDA
jgi:uncharacterized membrane protein